MAQHKIEVSKNAKKKKTKTQKSKTKKQQWQNKQNHRANIYPAILMEET